MPVPAAEAEELVAALIAEGLLLEDVPAVLPHLLPGEFLVSRIHVDLLRVCTACCPGC